MVKALVIGMINCWEMVCFWKDPLCVCVGNLIITVWLVINAFTGSRCGFGIDRYVKRMTTSQFSNLFSCLSQVILTDRMDKWVWELGLDGVFVVNSTQKHINGIFLQDGGGVTWWCFLVPLKEIIILLIVFLDRIPSLVNLMDRNVDVPLVLCPSCELQMDDFHHVFVQCDVAKNV